MLPSKLTLFNLLIITILSLKAPMALATEQTNSEYVTKPAGYSRCIEFPSNIRFNVPNYCTIVPAKISFITQGKGLVALKKETLKINKLTINGEDISKNSQGEATYEIGYDPKVTKNGEYLVFDIELKHAPFEKNNHIKLDGEIDILVSDKLAELSSEEIDTNKPYEINLGAFTITNKRPVPTKGQMIMNLFIPPEEKLLYTRIIGNIDGLLSFEVKEKEIELQRGSRSGSDVKSKTFTFHKPKQSKVTFELKYHDNLKKKTVKFSF